MDFKDIDCEAVGCIRLAQDRDKEWVLVFTVMNVRISYKMRNFEIK